MKGVLPCSLLFSSPLSSLLPSFVNLIPTTPIPVVHTTFNQTDSCPVPTKRKSQSKRTVLS